MIMYFGSLAIVQVTNGLEWNNPEVTFEEVGSKVS